MEKQRPNGLPRNYVPIKKISSIEHIGTGRVIERWLCNKIHKHDERYDSPEIIEVVIEDGVTKVSKEKV